MSVFLLFDGSLPHSKEIIALLFQEKKPFRAFLLHINFSLKLGLYKDFTHPLQHAF